MDFTKLDGLIPAVIQDDDSNEVLMVGFMNEEALDRHGATGYATFFSRTRSKLWMKGETSGNRLRVERHPRRLRRRHGARAGEAPGRRQRLPHGRPSCFTGATTPQK